VNRQPNGELLWGVVVEAEVISHEEDVVSPRVKDGLCEVDSIFPLRFANIPNA